MKLAIDASNIITGGGVTHLIEICKNIDPVSLNLKKIIIYGNKSTLNKVAKRDFIIKKDIKFYNKHFTLRIFWSIFILPILFKKSNCDLLFSPGGLVFSKNIPAVTMCRNMQPFEINSNTTYGFSLRTLRLYILKFLYKYSFNNARAVIFLTNYAKTTVSKMYNQKLYKEHIIPHGVNAKFENKSKKNMKAVMRSLNKPNQINIMYVSKIDIYKHQWNVIEATKILRDEKFPLKLTLIGSHVKFALQKMNSAIEKHDPKKLFVDYKGHVSYETIQNEYKKADIGLFASSCENMPNILIEMMRSGLPIACSSSGPMKEILKDGGSYFNPLSAKSIARAIKKIVTDDQFRSQIEIKSLNLSKQYDWKKCTKETFQYLKKIYEYEIR